MVVSKATANQYKELYTSRLVTNERKSEVYWLVIARKKTKDLTNIRTVNGENENT